MLEDSSRLNSDHDFFQELVSIVGKSHVVHDPKEAKHYGMDWSKGLLASPSVVVFPQTTQQVANVMSLCHKECKNVVPSGGRTGLSGGAAAINQEVVLSLEKMNKIETLDPQNLSVRVEAGVTTLALQQAAYDRGVCFPIDLAAKGSSQIGGNISTNAAGVKFLRYGGMREQILGLEVVLANGEILNLDSDVHKSNCGYDLKHLFIGSEGTLGIVTKATLKLSAIPQSLAVAICACENSDSLSNFLLHCNQHGLRIQAFELICQNCIDLVASRMDHLNQPFSETYPFYILIEIEQEMAGIEGIIKTFNSAIEQGIIKDSVIANSKVESELFWGLRENITESLSSRGGSIHKEDVSLSLAKLPVFIEYIKSVANEYQDSVILYLFGHIGDGNLHINFLEVNSNQPAALSGSQNKTFTQVIAEIQDKLFLKVAQLDGSLSGEHGIGLLRKKHLKFGKDSNQIQLMKQLKSLLDPKQILNPGKVFTED